MFGAAKICALFNATVLLGKYPQFYLFVFNENETDFQNIPGKYWESREFNSSMIQNDNTTFIAGVRLQYEKIYDLIQIINVLIKVPEFYLSDKKYQLNLWDVACSTLGIEYKKVPLKNSNLYKSFVEKDVDVVMLTYGPMRYEMFLNPFVTQE